MNHIIHLDALLIWAHGVYVKGKHIQGGIPCGVNRTVDLEYNIYTCTKVNELREVDLKYIYVYKSEWAERGWLELMDQQAVKELKKRYRADAIGK